VPVLTTDTALLARWRALAAVLFVDEAQDLDRTQLELAVLLAGERRDIFLVGDDDQTIYAWRLADVRRVLGLAARLPGLRRVDLETNHRCAPEIVRRAARLVGHNRERFSKTIRWSARSDGSLTLVPDSGDAVARARWLLSTWPGTPPGTSPSSPPGAPGQKGSRAVLARTNAELVPWAAVALELGLPYRVESDGLLLGEAAISAVVDLAMARSAPGRPLLLALAGAAAEAGLDASLRAALLAWAAPYTDLATFHRELVERTAARAHLSDGADALTLATIHGTKGLEWDHVICIGHDEGIFPAERALREASHPERVLEEERRLAYVAWTRARRSLAIVYDPGAPSCFLIDAFDRSELT
jgi:DNA helicase-2/ATP-dependent DNA helicase PcrA